MSRASRHGSRLRNSAAFRKDEFSRSTSSSWLPDEYPTRAGDLSGGSESQIRVGDLSGGGALGLGRFLAISEPWSASWYVFETPLCIYHTHACNRTPNPRNRALYHPTQRSIRFYFPIFSHNASFLCRLQVCFARRRVLDTHVAVDVDRFSLDAVLALAVLHPCSHRLLLINFPHTSILCCKAVDCCCFGARPRLVACRRHGVDV